MKKVEHFYEDEFGTVHVPACPVARAAWAKRGGDGPAQVATSEYRASWDRIFGGKVEIGQS